MNRPPSLYRTPRDPGGFPFGYNWRATFGGLALLGIFNFAASQYVAARFHYQPALGPPLFRTPRAAIYQPFAWCAGDTGTAQLGMAASGSLSSRAK